MLRTPKRKPAAHVLFGHFDDDMKRYPTFFDDVPPEEKPDIYNVQLFSVDPNKPIRLHITFPFDTDFNVLNRNINARKALINVLTLNCGISGCVGHQNCAEGDKLRDHFKVLVNEVSQKGTRPVILHLGDLCDEEGQYHVGDIDPLNEACSNLIYMTHENCIYAKNPNDERFDHDVLGDYCFVGGKIGLSKERAILRNKRAIKDFHFVGMKSIPTNSSSDNEGGHSKALRQRSTSPSASESRSKRLKENEESEKNRGKGKEKEREMERERENENENENGMDEDSNQNLLYQWETPRRKEVGSEGGRSRQQDLRNRDGTIIMRHDYRKLMREEYGSYDQFLIRSNLASYSQGNS